MSSITELLDTVVFDQHKYKFNILNRINRKEKQLYLACKILNKDYHGLIPNEFIEVAKNANPILLDKIIENLKLDLMTDSKDYHIEPHSLYPVFEQDLSFQDKLNQMKTQLQNEQK